MKLKKANIFTKVVIVALLLYAVVSIATVRADVAKTEKMRDELAAAVADMTQQNAELNYDIQHGTDDETIVDIARDKLGLVMPGEKIFYDVSD